MMGQNDMEFLSSSAMLVAPERLLNDRVQQTNAGDTEKLETGSSKDVSLHANF